MVEPAAPAILLLGARAAATAARVAAILPGAERWAPLAAACPAEVRFERMGPALRQLYAEGRPIIALCAAGIVVRGLAPVLADKHVEPPVIVVAEDGSAVVPLLGGHRGANALAGRIGAALGVAPAITTASDLLLGLALDAPPPGWRLPPEPLPAAFVARLLDGQPVGLEVEAGNTDWLRRGALRIEPDAVLQLRVTPRRPRADPEPATTVTLHPPVLVLGVGAARGAAAEALVGLAEACLAEAGLAAAAVACVASVDLKADEPAVHALAASLGVPARFFPADRLLEETSRLSERSAAVFAATGCWGVAEGAALAAVGPAGHLALAKRKAPSVTCAIALSPVDLDVTAIGRPRGRLAVVGLGPGDAASRTRAAETAIRAADHIVGYALYLDLAADLVVGKRLHPYPLGAETERCRRALELAAAGEAVALLASGDPGIYAMASLVLELVEREADVGWRRIELQIIPGVSAMQAAAALIGAPLGHDFCAVSLSDLMTPWPIIEARLEAAASADFALALYNPVSARRQAQLARARDILLRHRPPETAVVLARAVGRPGEVIRIVDLADLGSEQVDMLTTVLIGSRSTRRLEMGRRQLVFTPRGYTIA